MAATNVSAHASSASPTPTTTLQTRSTVGPWSTTTRSNGLFMSITSVDVTAGRCVRSPSEQFPRQRRGWLLELEQRPFAAQPTGIAGQAAARTDDAVARHDHAQRVA